VRAADNQREVLARGVNFSGRFRLSIGRALLGCAKSDLGAVIALRCRPEISSDISTLSSQLSNV